MQNRVWILASALIFALMTFCKVSALAQGMYHKIEPNFSGSKAVGKPIWVKPSSGKKYGLFYPKAGDTYQVGTYIPVNPAPATGGEPGYANFYLVDNKGIARLVHIQGGLSCGNDLHRVNFPDNSIWGIKIDSVANGEPIPSGEYSLVISLENHGESHSSRDIAGNIVARSEKFNVVNKNANYKPARFFGEASLELDPRLKLPANARHQFFTKVLCFYLNSSDPNKPQLQIYPDKQGHIDALVPPGTYKLESCSAAGSDFHSFFFDKHLLINPIEEQKITFASGELVELNFTLKNENAGANFEEGYLRYTVIPGQIKRTPPRR
jgi:hypothetical protein